MNYQVKKELESHGMLFGNDFMSTIISMASRLKIPLEKLTKNQLVFIESLLLEKTEMDIIDYQDRLFRLQEMMRLRDRDPSRSLHRHRRLARDRARWKVKTE